MNRVWLITGANSGFGRAITEAAIAGGDIAVATARRVTSLDSLATAHPGQVDALPLDVTDPAAVDATIRDVISRHGRIDVLVNNAGRTHVGAAEETTDAELRDLFEVHVFGPAALTRAVLPSMRSRRSAAILTALDAPNTPLRLPLGDDAIDAILSHLDSTRADIEAWGELARDTRLTS